MASSRCMRKEPGAPPGAAQLEGEDGLGVLALQEDAVAKALGEADGGLESRLDADVVHAAQQDALQIVVGGHGTFLMGEYARASPGA